MRARIQKISKYAPSIFQGKIDFASRHRVVSLTAEHPLERVASRVLWLTLALLACGYVYFVGASILHVIERKEALGKATGLANAVSSLEREYLVASQGIGPEDAARLGLSPIVDTAYVYRPGNAAAALVDGNEI